MQKLNLFFQFSLPSNACHVGKSFTWQFLHSYSWQWQESDKDSKVETSVVCCHMRVKGWEINECVSFIAYRSARLVLCKRKVCWCDTSALIKIILVCTLRLMIHWATFWAMLPGNFGKCCCQRATRWDTGPTTDLKYPNRNLLPIFNGKVPSNVAQKSCHVYHQPYK